MRRLASALLVVLAFSASPFAQTATAPPVAPANCAAADVSSSGRDVPGVQLAQSSCRANCRSRRGYCLSSCRDRQCRAICYDLYQSCLAGCR